MRESSVALATNLVFQCRNGHQFTVEPDPCTTLNGQTQSSSTRLRQRASWYEVNVLFVLGLLASGCGGTESSIIASFLGLPGSQYFGNNHFTAIEEEIGRYLREVAKETMETALSQEIEMSVSKSEFKKWKAQKNLPKLPEVAASYDMGWQKQSSGRTYNSISGHGMMIGCKSSKIIDVIILSKKCKICSSHKEDDPPPHECPKNYDGSSKGMEAEGSLRLCKKAQERRYSIGIIVSDDDSTM